MEQLRRILGTITSALSRLTVSQRLLVGSVAVILLMTLFLVTQYAGKSQYKVLMPGQSVEVQQQAARILATSQIKYTMSSTGELEVAPDEHDRAMAAVAQSGQGPANTELIFDNLVKTQNWFNSKEQNRQIYNLMRNNWLAGVISKFNGVRSAQVHVDAPEQVGFGAPQRAPKASITMFSSSGRAIAQETVDAAARFVSGSVSGLEVDRVEVIDGTLGRPRAVTNEREPAQTSARETARQIEKDWKQKIVNLLPGIDGLAVEVTAVVDAARVKAETSTNLPMGNGSFSTPKSEETTNSSELSSSQGVEPGVRANVGADLAASGASKGPRTQSTTEKVVYDVAIGTRTEHTDDPGGRVKSLAATVALPRAFIAAMIAKDRPAPASSANAGGTGAAAQKEPAPPSESEIQARFASEKASIESLLRPHFKMESAKGEVVQGDVVVALMSGDAGGMGSGGGGGSTPGTGGGSGGSPGGALGTVWAMGGGMIDKVVLGALAVVALAMMLMMARKAGRQVELPTPEELVGMPPTLETDSDLVGEADESETAMTGIEVGEDEIKLTKMREQVGELVKSQPDMAARVIHRWVSVEQ
jgi:flagellar biosynthesis/type III secretory pathway M-ring protein FliF/YscJ